MKNVRYAFAGMVICSVVGASMLGCVVGAADSSGEKVGEAESAFGESTCGTDYNTGSSFVEDTTSFSCGTQVTHSSADGSYTDVDCTVAFRVKYDFTPAAGLCSVKPIVEGTLPTNETDCTASFVMMNTYDSSGTLLHHEFYGATWSGTTCSFASTGQNGDDVKLAIAEAAVATCSPLHMCTFVRVQVGLQMVCPAC